MARELSAAFAAQLEAGRVRPFLLYEAHFKDGIKRLATSGSDVEWPVGSGQIWEGLGGSVVQISEIEETTDTKAAGVEIVVAMNPEFLSLALLQLQRNKPGTAYFGFFDANEPTDVIIEDPVACFKGYLDSSEIKEEVNPDSNEKFAGIVLRYENQFITFEKAPGTRWTAEQQRLRDPDDRGFEFINSLQDKTVPWGEAGGQAGGVATAGGGFLGGILPS